MAITLYPHQTKAIRELDNGKILKGGVGTGKSLTAMAYYYVHECGGTMPFNGVGEWSRMTTPKDIYVFTTAKKRDHFEWEGEALHFKVSRIREKSVDGVKITVDSWNNITNYTEIKDAFVIFDEQRLVGSGAWVKSFQKIAQNNRWIVLSATPGDIWLDYAPIFIANGFYKNRTDFIDQHVVYDHFSKYPKVKKYIGEAKLHNFRRRVLVDMPYRRHTKRHVSFDMVGYDRELYERVTKDRWHIYEDRPIRDITEMFSVMRKVVNSDVSRLGSVMRLYEKHPRLIIFYNFNYELDALRTLGNTLNVPVAEWNGHKHEEIPDSDNWLYLVQYIAGAEGWNCTSTDATIFYSMNYSYRLFEQAQGRIDRLNTPFTDLYYYVFRSGATIDQMIQKAITHKKNFNESAYRKAWDDYAVAV